VVVSILGEFVRGIVELTIRDGLIEAFKQVFRKKKQEKPSSERAKVLAKRQKDRHNRRRNR